MEPPVEQKTLPERPKEAKPPKQPKEKKPNPPKGPAQPKPKKEAPAPNDPNAMFKVGFLADVYQEKPSEKVVTRFPPEPNGYLQQVSHGPAART